MLKQLSDGCAACVASRRPLVAPGRARAAAGVPAPGSQREFNPRFEEEYVSGRDYDPDRERVEARRLKRALAKERRGGWPWAVWQAWKRAENGLWLCVYGELCVKVREVA